MELVCKQVLLWNPQKINRTSMIRPPADKILDDPVAFAHKVDTSPTLEQHTKKKYMGFSRWSLSQSDHMDYGIESWTYIACHREPPKISCVLHLLQSSQSCVHSLACDISVVSLQDHNGSQNLGIRQFESLALFAKMKQSPLALNKNMTPVSRQASTLTNAEASRITALTTFCVSGAMVHGPTISRIGY